MCVCVCVISVNHSDSKTQSNSHHLIPIKAISVNYLKMQLGKVATCSSKSQSRASGKERKNYNKLCLSKSSPHFVIFLRGADWV